MNLGIEHFRAARGDRLVLDNAAAPTAVRTASLTFRDKLVSWRAGGSFSHGDAAAQQANREFKLSFYHALVKAEGRTIADAAVAAAGLKPGWALNGKAMGDRQVRQILDQAHQLRLNVMTTNKSTTRSFLRDPAVGFARSFGQVAGPPNNYPAADVRDPALHKAFMRAVVRHPDFYKRPLTVNQYDQIAQTAITKFYQDKQAAFQEQHSGLAALAAGPRQDARTFFADMMARLSPGMAQGHALSTESTKFRDTAARALMEIQSNADLLSKMDFDPTKIDQIGNEMADKWARLQDLEYQLAELSGGDQPQTPDGRNLRQALTSEIRHQKALLEAKADFLDDFTRADPLSDKQVAYGNLYWAHAAATVIDEEIAKLPPGDGRIDQLRQAKQGFVDQAQNAYDNASPTTRSVDPAPLTRFQKWVQRRTHPIAQQKKDAKTFLENTFRNVGVNAKVDDNRMSAARRTALNTAQKWKAIERDMVVTKDGVTRTYRSKNIPGRKINARFKRQHDRAVAGGVGVPAHAPRQGVSAATTDDHYHARNLKVSTLERVRPDGSTQPKSVVIGHGVLDMWDIPDAQQRHAANVRGAKEVLEAAIATKPRLRDEAVARALAHDNRPVKLTHVSVNLITASTARDLGIQAGIPGLRGKRAYEEGTFTDSQFAAFEANTSRANGGQPVRFQLDDERPQGPGQPGTGHQDVNTNVHVDAITFSFAINPMATGHKMPDWYAGWSRVYDHNWEQMTKYIGDLGTRPAIGVGSRNLISGQSAVGTAVGGVVGRVVDRLDVSNPAQAEMKARIQEQVDLIREMFTSEAFKRGDGDAAKMGRHILALNDLVDQSLEMMGENGEAFTSSKGCKSDKDRGGMVDVEHKFQTITEDMGGQVQPNAKLETEDRRNYNIVLTSSGQLENQRLNTGLPGSKEAGHFASRIKDDAAKTYAMGWGKHVAA